MLFEKGSKGLSREMLNVMSAVQSVKREREADLFTDSGEGVQQARLVDGAHNDRRTWFCESLQYAYKRLHIFDMFDHLLRDNSVEGHGVRHLHEVALKELDAIGRLIRRQVDACQLQVWSERADVT